MFSANFQNLIRRRSLIVACGMCCKECFIYGMYKEKKSHTYIHVQYIHITVKDWGKKQSRTWSQCLLEIQLLGNPRIYKRDFVFSMTDIWKQVLKSNQR